MPESYKHFYAKKVLAQWLRDRPLPVKIHTENDHKLIVLEPIRALVPADAFETGVYEEYPVSVIEDSTTLHKVWNLSPVPSFENLVAASKPPSYILDIAIMHLGKIKYGIEVVHTHPVSIAKALGLEFMTRDIDFELYSISADWILNQCGRPYKLQLERLIPFVIRPLPFPTQPRKS